MKVFLSIAATMLFICSSVSAQENSQGSVVSPATEVSSKEEFPDWSNVNIQWNPSALVPEKGSSNSFTGLSIGLESCQSFTSKKASPFYGEFGIGFQYSFDSANGADFSMYAAKLNVGVGYAINIPSAPISLMPHAGIGYSWIFSAKTKVSGTTIDHFNEDDMGGEDYKWDNMPIGWYAGLKANICNKLVIGATYGMDFTKITKGTRIRTITISVGYCI